MYVYLYVRHSTACIEWNNFFFLNNVCACACVFYLLTTKLLEVLCISNVVLGM